MSWIAEYDTQGREFPACVHVTKTIGTMTHGATYTPIEDGKSVRAENEKLRELVRVFYHCTTSGKCDYCPINGGGTVKLMADTICDTLHDRMRELGVEVDGE